MKKMKLFPKIFLSALSLLCVMIVVCYMSLYVFLPVFYTNNMERQLEKSCEILKNMVQDVSFDSAKEILKTYAEYNNINIILRAGDTEEYYQGFYVRVAYLDGEDSETPQEGGGADMTEQIPQMQIDVEDMAGLETILIQETRAVSCDGRVMQLLLMANAQPVGQTKEVMKMMFPVVMGISLLFSVLFAYVCSRKITKPVIQMVEKTKDMEQLKEDAYFAVTSEDEIGILAKQINGVYAQLWEKIDALEKENKYISEIERAKVDFLRAASHELKTPLASLRILLENMQYNVGKYKDHETYLASCVETVDTLTAMVQDILSATRLKEHMPDAERERLPVQTEIEDILAQYEVLVRSKELAVTVELEESFVVEMNRDMFRKVCSNLIGNAVRYTDCGGEIAIKGGGGQLVIENTCEPLGEEQLSHIFEAFYRPDYERSRERGGNGLGLYLVKEILEANGAEYRFVPFEKGMRFIIEFAAV